MHTYNPLLLLHQQIPKPLHGLTPRTIYGRQWWDSTKRAAYAANAYHCHACGVHKDNATSKQRLEAHERYKIDYSSARATYIGTCALCPLCHMFIHRGLTSMRYRNREITDTVYRQILEHGYTVLSAAGLRRQHTHKNDKRLIDTMPWHAWRLVLDGQEYGPSTSSYAAWRRGDWKRYQVPTNKIPQITGVTGTALK